MVTAKKPADEWTKLTEIKLDADAVWHERATETVTELRGGRHATRPSYDRDTWCVDLSRAQARSGYAWSNGVLRLEKNPALHPLRARGRGSDPGLYHELAKHPQVKAPIEDAVSAVSSALMTLVPGSLPPWDLDSLGAAEAKVHQDAYHERVWHEWTRADIENGLDAWRPEAFRSAYMYGFALFEIVAKPFFWSLAGGPMRLYWVPMLEWRAPWSVEEWILQEDVLVGVVLVNTQSVDSLGQAGKSRVVLPAEKFLLVNARSMGVNPEGDSHLRPIVSHVEMLADAYTLEALATEVNAVGHFVIVEPQGGLTDPQRTELKKHIANYRAGNVPGLILPHGTTLQIVSPQAQMPELGGVISRHERAMGFGTNSEGKLVGTQKHGSNSARESAVGDQWIPYAYMATCYTVRPFQQLLGRGARLNFPDYVLMDRIVPPTIKIGSIERSTPGTHSAALGEALTSGVLDDPRTRDAAAEDLRIELPDASEAEPVADVEVPVVPLSSARPLMTVRESAEYLRCSPSTIRKWTAEGRLKPAGRKGAVGSYLYRIEDLVEFLGVTE